MFLKEIITVIVQIKAPNAAAASLTKCTKRRRRRQGSYRKHKNQGPWSRFLSDGKCALKWKVKWWSVFSSMNGVKRRDGTEELFHTRQHQAPNWYLKVAEVSQTTRGAASFETECSFADTWENALLTITIFISIKNHRTWRSHPRQKMTHLEIINERNTSWSNTLNKTMKELVKNETLYLFHCIH